MLDTSKKQTYVFLSSSLFVNISKYYKVISFVFNFGRYIFEIHFSFKPSALDNKVNSFILQRISGFA